ncbi:hypothetical protein BJV78DRAFT_266693 [Lactifluus subvellereus]|nr:hypothetical protein BJV78DRAFT_266693 [Lactifluus subvellereus]
MMPHIMHRALSDTVDYLIVHKCHVYSLLWNQHQLGRRENSRTTYFSLMRYEIVNCIAHVHVLPDHSHHQRDCFKVSAIAPSGNTGLTVTTPVIAITHQGPDRIAPRRPILLASATSGYTQDITLRLWCVLPALSVFVAFPRQNRTQIQTVLNGHKVVIARWDSTETRCIGHHGVPRILTKWRSDCGGWDDTAVRAVLKISNVCIGQAGLGSFLCGGFSVPLADWK